MASSKDELDPLHPALTEAKVAEMLGSAFGDVEVLSSEVSSAAAKGENYSSQVCRLDATVRTGAAGEEREVHWILKLPKNDPQRFALHRLNKMESKEIEMYNEFIPGMKKFVKDKGLENEIELNFCSSLYNEFTDSGSVIALENLTHAGYLEAADKKDGLSLEYCRAVVDGLASYHAAAHAYMSSLPSGQDHSDLRRDYTLSDPEPDFVPVLDMYMGVLRPMTDANLTALQESPEEDRVGSVRRAEERICGEPGNFPKAMKSLLQGCDFKHDKDGKPVTMCLVDLAVTRWSSPMVDLVYFFYLCVTPRLRRDSLYDLLRLYHGRLTGALEKLGLDPGIYTFSDVLADYDRLTYWGLMFSFMALPGLLCRQEDATGLEKYMSDGSDPEAAAECKRRLLADTRASMDREPRIRTRLGGNYDEAQRRGLFDQ